MTTLELLQKVQRHTVNLIRFHHLDTIGANQLIRYASELARNVEPSIGAELRVKHQVSSEAKRVARESPTNVTNIINETAALARDELAHCRGTDE